MKKRFVFWIAKILKVEIFEKETTEITHRTTAMKFSLIDVRKVIPLYEVHQRLKKGLFFNDLKNELAVELASRMINEDKVGIEEYKSEIDQMQHIRLFVEVADQKQY